MLVMSVLYLLLGAVLLCWPTLVLDIICYVVGGLVLLSGVSQLARFLTARERLFFAPLTLMLGIVCLGLGLFLIFRSDIVQTVLPMVFGLFVLFDSVLRIQNALELRRCHSASWPAFLGLALLSVVLGGVMIYNPFGAINTLVMAIGVILCIEGALNLTTTLYTTLVVRSWARRHPEVTAALEEITGEDLDGDGVVGGREVVTAVEVTGDTDPAGGEQP